MSKHATGSTHLEKSGLGLAFIHAAHFSKIIMSDRQRLEQLVSRYSGISDYHFEAPKSRKPTEGNFDSYFDTKSPLAVQPRVSSARELHYGSGSSNFATQTGVCGGPKHTQR